MLPSELFRKSGEPSESLIHSIVTRATIFVEVGVAERSARLALCARQMSALNGGLYPSSNDEDEGEG